MKSLSEDLPPDVARQIHPEWRKNEEDYWAVRDQLLAQYGDQWMAFAQGRVVAFGANPVQVLEAALNSQEHPFFARIGHETEPWCRIRRASGWQRLSVQSPSRFCRGRAHRRSRRAEPNGRALSRPEPGSGDQSVS